VYERWLWPLPSHLAYFLRETDVPAMMGVDFMARYSQVGGYSVGIERRVESGHFVIVFVSCGLYV
jgi:hypothetical protein